MSRFFLIFFFCLWNIMSFENDTKLEAQTDRTQHSKTNASLVAQIDVTVKVNYSSGYYNVNTTFDQELRGSSRYSKHRYSKHRGFRVVARPDAGEFRQQVDNDRRNSSSSVSHGFMINLPIR